jgi:flavin-dependent dehydrogenase
MRRVPVLIVGGGPAGSAAAIALARGGVAAELIERRAAPHDSVCGGFLGWDALAELRRIGVDPPALGARPIGRLRLVAGRRTLETDLPYAAAGLSRRCLDEALLTAAADAGATIRRGVAARAGEAAGAVRLGDGTGIMADALILATGKYELRGLARPLPGRRGEGAVGLRTSFLPDAETRAALTGTIELHPFNGGYAGLLLQEDGRANLCMSVAAARLRRAGGIAALLDELAQEAPRLGQRLGAAAGQAWLTISNVPYGWRARPGPDRLYRVGDQAAVIASLAGDGIAIALASGRAAAESCLNARAAPAYQRRFHAQASRPLKVAQGLRWAAERPLPRRLLLGLARIAPSLAGTAAKLTRIRSG